MTSATAPGDGAPTLLTSLAAVLEAVHVQGPATGISTGLFSELIEILVTMFDHMGAVLHVAKHEMVVKAKSLKEAAAEYPSLAEVVAADVKAGRATVKDSCARNLHRLVYTITFVRVLLEQLMASKTTSTKEAAQKAYDQSLSPIHPYMIRTAVWASLHLLPARDSFMLSLGETEETASVKAAAIVAHSKDVEARVLELYKNIKMPAASMTANLMAGLWGGKAAPAPAATAAAH